VGAVTQAKAKLDPRSRSAPRRLRAPVSRPFRRTENPLRRHPKAIFALGHATGSACLVVGPTGCALGPPFRTTPTNGSVGADPRSPLGLPRQGDPLPTLRRYPGSPYLRWQNHRRADAAANALDPATEKLPRRCARRCQTHLAFSHDGSSRGWTHRRRDPFWTPTPARRSAPYDPATQGRSFQSARLLGDGKRRCYAVSRAAASGPGAASRLGVPNAITPSLVRRDGTTITPDHFGRWYWPIGPRQETSSHQRE